MRDLRLPGIVLLLALGVASPTRAEWVVDASGRCVRTWTPASLLRGPTAIVSAPTAPVRTAAGVFTYQSPRTGGWNTQAPFAVAGPVVAFASGAAALIDTTVWLGAGVADTVTGGYFALAPPEATELSLAPMRPPFMTPASPPRVDCCGRPVS
jgi:hypothetical protein